MGEWQPKVIDNDVGEITVTLNGRELRGWSYKDDAERRTKMLAAREFVEGYCDGREAQLSHLKDRISTRLDDYLCGMKPDYDDSIAGFNEAWDQMRHVLDHEHAAIAKATGNIIGIAKPESKDMLTEQDKIAAFVRERDEMLMAMDVDQFYAFYAKYNPGHQIANRAVAEISLHKARTAAKTLPMFARALSKQWLEERGYASRDNGDISPVSSTERNS